MMMRSILRRMLGSVVALMVATGAAHAGPIAEFESALRAAHADYRTALFETNRKNKAATDAALGAFDAKWRALTARWRASPPPHLSEDAQWQASLDKILALVTDARAQTAAADLAKAHETLEAIRGVLGTLRERNGQVTFSDRMDAFHEQMEHTAQKAGEALNAETIAALREEAAVLNHLASLLRRHQPAETKSDAAFEAALKPLEASVGEFIAAVRRGDAAAIKAAAQKLKPAYARLFVKYG